MGGFRYNLGYDQRTYGIVDGVDLNHHGLFSPDDTALIGVAGGYLNSDVNFDAYGSAPGFEGTMR